MAVPDLNQVWQHLADLFLQTDADSACHLVPYQNPSAGQQPRLSDGVNREAPKMPSKQYQKLPFFTSSVTCSDRLLSLPGLPN